MANFEMYPREPSPAFLSNGGGNATLSMVSGPSNSLHVALRGGVWGDRPMAIGVDLEGAGVIKVEPALLTPGEGLRVFHLTGKKPGSAIIEARVPDSNQIAASLAVFVTAMKSASAAPRVVAADPLTSFEIGFIEGLATAKGSRNVSMLIGAIKAHPGQFFAGYVDGVASGLWAGVKDLFDGLVALGAMAPYVAGAIAMPGVGAAVLAWKLSDPEFRRKALDKAEWAKSVAEAAKAVVVEFNKDMGGSVVKYLNASSDAGRKIGEAFAVEIDKKAQLGGAIEYGQWIGWAVGRIAFELIVLLATEGIGEAVKGASAGGKGLKGIQAAGEAAELFARVRTKIEEVLKGLPALENFVRTLTKTKSAQQAAEAGAKVEAVAEAAEAAARSKPAVADELGEAFDRQFGKLERGELADEQGAMLGDLMFHGQRREAMAQLRQQVGHLPTRPGKTPIGDAVNPRPGYQSAHTTPQSMLRPLPQYNPNEMITRFLPTGKGHAHTVFDQAWQREFADIVRRTGRTTTTARELEEVVGRAARNSGAFSRAEGESVAQLIKNDLYFQLGLSPETPLRMPGH